MFVITLFIFNMHRLLLRVRSAMSYAKGSRQLCHHNCDLSTHVHVCVLASSELCGHSIRNLL
jgi:hypothetical protein